MTIIIRKMSLEIWWKQRWGIAAAVIQSSENAVHKVGPMKAQQLARQRKRQDAWKDRSGQPRDSPRKYTGGGDAHETLYVFFYPIRSRRCIQSQEEKWGIQSRT